MKRDYLFTSESVSEGHPDKVCDRISDMVVDTYLSKDPISRVACETLTTTNKVVLAGEIRGPSINKDEIIFTELIQKTSNKTNLIVNISEDGWFGNSIGPHQHFAKAIFRSIENNSFLVRSANKGISAIINNKGEITKKLNTHETGSIEMNIPLLNSEFKNKNDLIFFILLFTYLFIFLIFKNKR